MMSTARSSDENFCKFPHILIVISFHMKKPNIWSKSARKPIKITLEISKLNKYCDEK